MLPRTDLGTALFFTGGAIPYTFQNSMAVFPLPGQEYSMLTQAAAPYATMMLPQPAGGTALYLPASLHSNATAPGSAYAHISQHTVTAALQQQLQQTGNISGLAPAVVGQIAPVNVTTNNTSPPSQSTTAVMAAAAAAMAAAVQWPQQTAQNNPHGAQQLAAMAATHGAVQATNDHHSVGQTTITQQQAAAAAVAAQQQTTWRWSPNLQNTMNGTSPQSGICTGVSTTSPGIGVTTSSPTIQSTHNVQGNQQCSNKAAYVYSPLIGGSHEVMLFHQQTSSPFTGNSTSDYSTDHSTHSSGIMESVESLSFHYGGTPIGRQVQQQHHQQHQQQQQHFTGNQLTNIYHTTHMDNSCLTPYTPTFTPILEFPSHSQCIGRQNPLHQFTSTPQLQQNLRQSQVQPEMLSNHQVNAFVSIVNPSVSSHLNKMLTTTCPRQLSTTVYGNHPTNATLNDMNSSNDLNLSSISQVQSSATIGVQGSTNQIISQSSTSVLTSTTST
ncbi:unnamed protein product [Heterobilharzia americana]|nr:unnamed protein product [Heterobilharzia americana]